MSPAPDARTHRGRVGLAAEELAWRHLEALGWQTLARNLIVGRDELDLVCIDPRRATCLVFVEVRGHASSRFGAAEESVDRRKLARTYRAALGVLRSEWLRDLGVGARMPWRVDVIAVELAPSLARGAGGPSIRHIEGVTPD